MKVNEYEIKAPRQPICYEDNISIEYIEKLALIQLENFKSPEFVYLSTNLYKKLIFTLESQNSYNSPNAKGRGFQIFSIMTSAGELTIKELSSIEDFCYVGSETSFEQIEWVRVGMEFEEAFLGVE